jgi:hypothetical protein
MKQEICVDEVYVPCVQNHKNCFSYKEDGTCDCLTDTDFKKKCPFYTSKEEYEKQLQADIERKRQDPANPFQ